MAILKIILSQIFYCYIICQTENIPCPLEKPIAFKNQCIDKCPEQTKFISDLNMCIDKCADFTELYDVEKQKCIKIQDCQTKFVDIENMTCLSICPSFYKIQEKLESCIFINKKCTLQNSFEKKYKICQRDMACYPPMGWVQIQGIVYCQNLDSSKIIDTTFSNDNEIFALDNFKKCKGIISFDEKYCGLSCNTGEYAKWDQRGFYKCVPCLYFKQINSETGQLQCLQQCKSGYIGNGNKTCFPLSQCPPNQMTSSDGKMCTDKCIFPDYIKDGKCVLWKITDSLNKCLAQGQIINATQPPPYNCISRDQCMISLTNNDYRCSLCKNSDFDCISQFVNNKDLQKERESLENLIQSKGGIISIENLNFGLMSLDWFTNFAADFQLIRQDQNFTSINQIYLITKKIYFNSFLKPVQEPILQECVKNYKKIGTQFYFPSIQLSEYICYFSTRFYKNDLQLKYEPLSFGQPQKIRVAYQIIQQGFDVKQFIDTTEFDQENNVIQLKGEQTSNYNQTRDMEMLIILFRNNTYCNNDILCKNYPLVYIQTSEISNKISIKFALKPSSPKTDCSYYIQKNNRVYRTTLPGCITQDSKFMICPYQFERISSNLNRIYMTLYENEKGESPSICTQDNNINESTSKNKQEESEQINMELDTNKCSGKQFSNNDNDDSSELSKSQLVGITVCASTLFFASVFLGAYLLLRTKYQFRLRSDTKTKEGHEKEDDKLQLTKIGMHAPASNQILSQCSSNQQID